MTAEDRLRWDASYAAEAPEPTALPPRLPEVFAPYEDEFPTGGQALELACGRGEASVWLALRGLDVVGADVSPVAIRHARELAVRSGVSERCRFETADLDAGLPPGPPTDVLLCHMFRDKSLDQAVKRRLKTDGLLAISCRSVVGAGPGPFRAAAGELRSAFADLRVIAGGEGDGRAWLIARGRTGR